jgi:hypothetical protein
MRADVKAVVRGAQGKNLREAGAENMSRISKQPPVQQDRWRKWKGQTRPFKVMTLHQDWHLYSKEEPGLRDGEQTFLPASRHELGWGNGEKYLCKDS